MSVNSFMFSNTAKKAVDRKEKLRDDGYIPKVSTAGVMNFIPADNQGKALIPKGGSFAFGNSEVMTADGSFRIVQASDLDRDLKEVERAEKSVMKVMDVLIKSGSDSLAYRYLGKYAKLLEEKISVSQYEGMLGYAAGTLDKLAAQDARPSVIRFTDPRSGAYADKINKLKIAVQVSGIYLAGTDQGLGPDNLPSQDDIGAMGAPTTTAIPANAQGALIEKLFN